MPMLVASPATSLPRVWIDIEIVSTQRVATFAVSLEWATNLSRRICKQFLSCFASPLAEPRKHSGEQWLNLIPASDYPSILVFLRASIRSLAFVWTHDSAYSRSNSSFFDHVSISHRNHKATKFPLSPFSWIVVN